MNKLMLTNDFGPLGRGTRLRFHRFMPAAQTPLRFNKPEGVRDVVFMLASTYTTGARHYVPALWCQDLDDPAAWDMIVAAAWRNLGGRIRR